METDREWSQIPNDILTRLLKLLSPVDHLNFGGVCKSWRLVRSLLKTHHDFQSPQTPWFLLGYEHQSETQNFYSYSDDKIYKIRLKAFKGKQCCGSFHSWVLLRDTASSVLSLLNPFSDIQVRLPKLEERYFCVALSSETDLPDCTIMAVCRSRKTILHCKPGDSKWNKHCYEIGEDWNIVDLIAIRESSFRALTARGRLISIQVHGQYCTVTPMDELGYVWQTIDSRSQGQTYLVKWTDDIFAITEVLDPLTRTITSLSIFRLDWRRSTWVEVDNLEDKILFLGTNSSTVILYDDEDRLHKNSVYFAGFGAKKGAWNIFNLKDRTMEAYSTYDDNGGKIGGTWAVWLMPRQFYKVSPKSKILKMLSRLGSSLKTSILDFKVCAAVLLMATFFKLSI